LGVISEIALRQKHKFRRVVVVPADSIPHIGEVK
jgi:hypothetical protein